MTSCTQETLYDELLKLVGDRFCRDSQVERFSKYQTDPVGFGEEILGERFTDDVKAMMESVRDNIITLARSANAVGKTHGAARVAIWFYKCFGNCQVYTAAAPPESNLRNLLWGEIGNIIEKHPDLFKRDEVKNLHVSRSAQSFLTGVTIPTSGSEAQREAKFSGKHSPNLLFVVDEGDAVPDEVFRGIESCMSGGHARLLIMLNPRAEAGEAYRMSRDRKAKVVSLSAFNHPNVVEGRDVIPGAVTRETTVRRINQWCRPLAEGEPVDGECFELPKFLEGAVASRQDGQSYDPLRPGWYKVMEPAFAYMVLGQYPSKGSAQLISRAWVIQARQRWDAHVAEHGERPPQYSMAVMGLDVGEYGSDSNAACFRCGGFVERLTTWGGIDTIQTADRAIGLYRERNALRCNVDATGIGAGVAPYMARQGCSAVPVKVASSPTQKTDMGEFQILRDQLWWACREWLRADPGAMLPPDEYLIEELLVPTYEIKYGKIRVMSKDTMRELLRRSPDRADALCLTFLAGGFFAECDLR